MPVFNQTQLNEQADREIAFIKLARANPQAELVYSGGSSRLTNHELKGADAGAMMLKEVGFDTSRVIFEQLSRNTYESALLTYKLVDPGIGENWILITSAFHMPRSIGAFCSQGWSVIPYPVDFKVERKFQASLDFSGHLQILALAIKEWIGLFAYWVTEKSQVLYPGDCTN